jgi:hypothetical protein
MADQKPSTAQSQPDVKVDFQLSDFSVICGRGRDSFNHIGNRRFRILASMHIERYSRADSKVAKTGIVSEIIEVIRQADGNFCKFTKGKWFEVADHHAREKVSSLMRDLLHTQYRSSAKAKIARRKSAKTETRKKAHNQKRLSDPKLVDDAPRSEDSSTSTDVQKQHQNQQSGEKLVENTPPSDVSSMQDQNQQINLKPVNDTVDSDDSSTSSACWGCTKDSLGFEYLVDDNFFDIDVF